MALCPHADVWGNGLGRSPSRRHHVRRGSGEGCEVAIGGAEGVVNSALECALAIPSWLRRKPYELLNHEPGCVPAGAEWTCLKAYPRRTGRPPRPGRAGRGGVDWWARRRV